MVINRENRPFSKQKKADRITVRFIKQAKVQSILERETSMV